METVQDPLLVRISIEISADNENWKRVRVYKSELDQATLFIKALEDFDKKTRKDANATH